MSFIATQLIGFGAARRYSLVSSGLVGWWKLADGSGTTAIDSSGNARDGTLVGTPTWTSGPRGFGAVDFNGSSQYITVADNAAFSPVTTGQFAICCWFYADALTGHIVAKTGTSDGYEFMCATAESTFWQNLGATHAGTGTGAAANTGEWTHAAVNYQNATAIEYYRNGALLVSSTTFSGSMVDGAGLVNIGRRPDNTNYFDGRVSDVRLYNRILTQAEITAIANAYG